MFYFRGRKFLEINKSRVIGAQCLYGVVNLTLILSQAASPPGSSQQPEEVARGAQTSHDINLTTQRQPKQVPLNPPLHKNMVTIEMTDVCMVRNG